MLCESGWNFYYLFIRFLFIFLFIFVVAQFIISSISDATEEMNDEEYMVFMKRNAE
jgi:hypothetical protein